LDKKRCNFNTTLDGRGSETYECPDNEYSEGYCKFHHPTYATNDDNKADLIELLEQKIDNANASGSALELIGYKLPRELSISSYQFKSNVHLDNAEFLGNTYFRDSVFEKDVSFSGATFNGDVIFNEITFNEKASFQQSKLKGKAQFHEVVRFHGGADFSNATFSSEVLFYEVHFGDSSFSNATFHGEARFTETSFTGEARFDETTFHGEVSFNEGGFNGAAEFIETDFNRKVQFNDIRFHGGADFSHSTFHGEVSFNEITFERHVSSYKTTFNGEASFHETTFNGEAGFEESKFNGILSFTDNTIKGSLSFAQVFFKEKDQIIFNGDLSRVSFASTDITRVQFGDKVVWGRNQINSGTTEPEDGNNNTHNKERFDFKIYDERRIEESVAITDAHITTNSLETVIAEYRNLRENYEYYLRYEEAGKFFIREMELRRNYSQPLSTSTESISKRNIFARNLGLIGLYRLVCDYGESIRKPLIIIISAFIFATIFFSYERGWSMENFDPVRKTLAAFFPFFSLNNDPSLPEMILKATMLPMVGLLFITLRRKLERRFRH
jgi:uncharacterized protein YjbI with pentapeptide repeats